MLRTKLLLLFLSGTLLFAACSDTGTDSEPSEEEGETVEPKASINNPSDGALLEGEITFSIEGQSEDGFDEARIYLDDELVETVENPSLPHDQKIATYNYNNADYDLKAELDPSAKDTTVSASIGVTLENYMVTLETDGYIELLNEYYDAGYLFISDPSGKVLGEVELTAQSDGEFNLLPPSELEEGAPDNYSVTIARAYTFNNQQRLSLTTDIGLKPWSRIYREGSVNSDEGSSTRELSVEMSNFDQTPLNTRFVTAEDHTLEHHPGADLTTAFEVTEGLDDLVISHNPDHTSVQDPVPVYRWENNLAEMESSQSYNVTEDFNKMVSHSVSVPSEVKVRYYRYFMTVAPNSYDEGDIYFGAWSPDRIGDANGDESGLGIWVPEISERSFITHMTASDQSNDNISHAFQSPVMDGFPAEFTTVDAGIQINNKSLDDFQVDISGNSDLVKVAADNSTDNYHHRWSVALPDSATTFTFPEIGDRLNDVVNNYNRSGFKFSSVNMYDYGKFDGYGDYLDSEYADTDFGHIIEWARKYKSLSSQSKQKRINPELQQPKNRIIDFSDLEEFIFRKQENFDKDNRDISY